MKHLRRFHPSFDADAFREKKKKERNRKPGRKTIEGEGAIVYSNVKFKIVNGQTALVDETAEAQNGSAAGTSGQSLSGSLSSSVITSEVTPAIQRPMASSTVVGGHISAVQTMTKTL